MGSLLTGGGVVVISRDASRLVAVGGWDQGCYPPYLQWPLGAGQIPRYFWRPLQATLLPCLRIRMNAQQRRGN